MASPDRASFRAGWGDMDFNGHMANRAFLDYAGTSRMLYFAAGGFPMEAFQRLRVGPVVRRDTLEYFREILLLEEFTVEILCAGLAPDGSKMRLRNVFLKGDGQRAAVVTTDGGWLDLATRRLRAPTPELLDLLRGIARSGDYEDLPSSLA